MALVAVLLLVAGLIAIATAVVTLSAAQRRAAQRSDEVEQRRITLDSALRIAIAEISFPKLEGPFWPPRQPRTLPIGEARVEVTLERESGRIDLNTADEKYLVAGLVVAGLEEARAREGAARIRDWTDADDEVRKHGAELEQYRAAGMPGPRNGPFERVEELRQVMGLGMLNDETLDSFTVYSQQSAPFATEAPTRVREAIAWLTKAAGEGGSTADVPSSAVTEDSIAISYAGSLIRMRACGAESHAKLCRTVVVRFTGSSRAPVQIFLWH